jgi:hypothetical protein
MVCAGDCSTDSDCTSGCCSLGAAACPTIPTYGGDNNCTCAPIEVCQPDGGAVDSGP